MNQINMLQDLITKQPPDLTSWKTVNIQCDSEAKIQQLIDLCKDNPKITLYDTILKQLQDLIRTRHPNKTLSDEALNPLIKDYLKDAPLETYGTWVYYPWSNRLVHVLAEKDFIELRTNRNKYKITEAEQEALAHKKIGIIGLSVGAAAAITLTLERAYGEIRLADFDSLDVSNLNRLRTGINNIGLAKVYCAAREIAEIDPYVHVRCFDEGIHKNNIDQFIMENGKLDLIIEECDTLETKFKIRYLARQHKIPVIMDTSDRGLIDIERFDIEPDRRIFHGKVEELSEQQLSALDGPEKLAYILRIIDHENISDVGRASALEIGQTIKTWPQLASDVAHGGAAATDTARKILLGQTIESGRYYVDLNELIGHPNHTPKKKDSVCCPHIKKEDMSQLLPSVPHLKNEINLDESKLKELISAACRAPSGANCQPWQWYYKEATLYLMQDPYSKKYLIDCQGLGSTAALGAAYENLVLAAHHANIGLNTTVLPFKDQPDIIACIKFCPLSAEKKPVHAYDDLYPYINARHTNRKTVKRQEIPPETLAELSALTKSVPDSNMQFITEKDKLIKLGQILGHYDKISLLCKDRQQEIMREIRWNESETRETHDGISLESLELPPEGRAYIQLLRHWDALELISKWGKGDALTEMAKRNIASASAMGLITMNHHSKADYFCGGQLLERTWLLSTKLQLGFWPMTALPYMFARLAHDDCQVSDDIKEQIKALRAIYREIFHVTDDMAEILLFRLSIAEPSTKQSARHSVEEVLHIIN